MTRPSPRLALQQFVSFGRSRRSKSETSTPASPVSRLADHDAATVTENSTPGLRLTGLGTSGISTSASHGAAVSSDLDSEHLTQDTLGKLVNRVEQLEVELAAAKRNNLDNHDKLAKLADKLDGLVDGLADRLADKLADKLANKLADSDKPADSPADSLADKIDQLETVVRELEKLIKEQDFAKDVALALVSLRTPSVHGFH